MAVGDGTLKIDLMKPALYEETFIRSVEYITTITIIMPKKQQQQQQQHLIFSFSLCVWDRRGEAHFSPCIVMILSEVPQLLRSACHALSSRLFVPLKAWGHLHTDASLFRVAGYFSSLVCGHLEPHCLDCLYEIPTPLIIRISVLTETVCTAWR